MKSFLIYWLWPNPGIVPYDNLKVQALLVFGAVLIVASFFLSLWRRKRKNPVTKSLSKSWSTATAWFGIVAIILTISRAEGIQYLSMRLLWVLWILLALLYIWFQMRMFRSKHYEKLPTATVTDPRSKYLPKKKKR